MKIMSKIKLRIIALVIILLSLLGGTTVYGATYGSGGRDYLINQISAYRTGDSNYYYYTGNFFMWSYGTSTYHQTYYENGWGKWTDAIPGQIENDLYNPQVVEGYAYLGGPTSEFGWAPTGTTWNGDRKYTASGVTGNSSVRYTRAAKTTYRKVKTQPVSTGVQGYSGVYVSGGNLWARQGVNTTIRIDSYQNPAGTDPSMVFEDYAATNHIRLYNGVVDARASYDRWGGLNYWATSPELSIDRSWTSVSGNTLHTAYLVRGNTDGTAYHIHSHAYSQNGKEYGYIDTGYIFRVDGAAPTGSYTNWSGGWNSTGWSTTFTPSDSGSGVQAWWYTTYKNGVALESGQVNGATAKTFSFPDEGVYRVETHVFDNVGNNAYAHSGSFHVDKSAPSVPSIAVSRSGWGNTPGYFFPHSGWDALSGVNRYGYQVNWGGWIGNWTEAVTVYSEGANLIHAVTIDNVGHWSGVNQVYIYNDFTIPSGSFSTNGTGWSKGPVTTTFTPSDGLSGVSGWWYTVRNASGGAVEQGYITGGGAKTFTINGNGEYYIETHVMDNAGNSAYPTSNRFYIDNIKPTLVGASVSGHSYSSGVWRWFKPTDTVTIDQTMTDDYSGLLNIYAQITNGGSFQRRIGISSGGGAPWVDYMGGTASTFSEYNAALISSSGNQRSVRYSFKIPYDGSYSYYAQTLDYAYNWAGPSEAQGLGTNLGIGIDGTAPTVTVTPSTTAWTTNPVTVKVTATDSGSGLNSIEMTGQNGYQGVNLLRGTNEVTEYVSGNEFLRTPWDLAPIINKHGLVPYTLSFEMKAPIAGGMQAYMQNGSSSRYHFAKNFNVTTAWKRYVVTFTPVDNQLTTIESYLAFYGVYGTGVRPTIRKAKLELGTQDTPYTVAPEDIPMISGEKSYVISKSGTYTFRVKDNVGNYVDKNVTINNIDTTPPTASIIQNPTTWTNKPVEITVTGIDSQSGIGSITQISEPVQGRNYLRNSQLDVITASLPWNQSLNGNLIPSYAWSGGHNGGVPNPTVGYHANINTTQFGYPVMAYINKNSTYGVPNRWLGFAQGFEMSSPIGSQIVPGQKITVSFDLYSDKPGALIRGGLYRVSKNTGTNDFFSLKFTSTTVANQWQRVSFEQEVDWNWDTSKAFALYLYGEYDTDATKYVKNVKLEIGSETPYTIAPEDVKMVGSTKKFSVSSNGVYRYLISDNVGHSVESAITISNIDMTAPQGTITGNPIVWTNQNVPLTFSATDSGGSGVKRVHFVGDAWVNSSTVTRSVGANGTYTFEVEDNAGNITSNQIVVSKIDKIAPVGGISPSTTAWTNGNVTLTLSPSDAGGSGYKQTKLPDGTIVTNANPTYVATANGTYNFIMYDNAGNTTNQFYIVSNIDRINPVVTASPSSSDWVDDKVVVDLNFTDSQSGISTRQYAWTKDTAIPTVWTNYTGTIEQSAQGIWYLHYKAVDKVGNIAMGCFGQYKVKRESGIFLESLKVTPEKINMRDGELSSLRAMSVTFAIGNTIFPNHGKPINPIVTIKYGTDTVNTTLWKQTIQMPANGKTTRTVSFDGIKNPKVLLSPGKKIIVEVNGVETGYLRFDEYHYSGSNPYLDNIMSVFITVAKQSDITCPILTSNVVRKFNSWTERWTKTTQTATVQSSSAFTVISRVTENQVSNYNESYEITQVRFRSKYTKDNASLLSYVDADGWQTVIDKNEATTALELKQSIAKIKAGYGFELMVETHYRTNRNIVPVGYTESFADLIDNPSYGKGYANYTIVSPAVTPIDSPGTLYLNMKSSDSYIVCQELENTFTIGPWYDQKKTFEVKENDKVGVGTAERKVWTSVSAIPGTYDVTIATPNTANVVVSKDYRFKGYEEEAPVFMGDKSYLSDIFNFQIEILGQDDIKSHYGY